MVQTIAIIFGIIVVIVFVWDIRNRAMAHKRAVQKVKEEIAHLTHMTATISTFADGKANEVLLGVSEDSSLFFYRLIVRGKVAAQYTLHLPNVLQAVLLINGEKKNIATSSAHKMAIMQATDIAKQIRLGLTPEMVKNIRSITLEITFKSEDGSEKVLPVHVLRQPTPEMQAILPKTFENAVWWQQYLSLMAKSSTQQPTE